MLDKLLIWWCTIVRSHISKTTWPNFTKFLCMLAMIVDRSSSDGVSIRYVGLIPVLWTLCLHVMAICRVICVFLSGESISRVSTRRGWRIGAEVCCLPLPCFELEHFKDCSCWFLCTSYYVVVIKHEFTRAKQWSICLSFKRRRRVCLRLLKFYCSSRIGYIILLISCGLLARLALMLRCQCPSVCPSVCDGSTLAHYT